MSANPLLTQTAEYALRAMSCLAITAEDYVTAAALAAHTDIPRHYVSKILRRLAVAGLVDGRKGHHGGFRLARPPSRIALRDILAAVDALPGYTCAFGRPSCSDEHPCPLHESWSELKAAYMTWMDRHTLDHLRGSDGGHCDGGVTER